MFVGESHRRCPVWSVRKTGVFGVLLLKINDGLFVDLCLGFADLLPQGLADSLNLLIDFNCFIKI